MRTSTNRKFTKILAAFTAFILIILGGCYNSINVKAASAVPEQYRCIFNAEYYAAKYPDLAAVFGSNEAALFNHFLTCGMAEGRQGSAEFDVNFYRAAYPDLQAVFGDDLAAYYNHYMTCGKNEGRIGAGTAPAQAVAPATNNQTASAQVATGGARVYQFTGNWRESEKRFYANILNSILTPGMSDMEVAKAIHDYLCRTYHYVQAGETVTTLDDIYMYSIGIYEDGYGDYANADLANSKAFYCGGYSMAYYTLMNIAGIPTADIWGVANGGPHGWNCSLINGQYLYTDVCWDDYLNTTRYFMISGSQMEQDHTTNQVRW